MSELSSEGSGLRLSFLEIFNPDIAYSYVEIPLIQRDYAQGRASVGAVRERFLRSLKEALVGQSGELSLDFVYGEVVERQNGEKSFQPIDGQQRLTTLYLLHWFLACVAGQKEQEDFRRKMRNKKGEPRFQYSVRLSSHQFFSRLLNFSPEPGQSLRKQIEDQSWFFRAWLHDPTIQGAMVVLDAIREEFYGVPGVKEFYCKLAQADETVITLDVLDLDSVGQSDEIYVKMNARGKELTGFEKFKAKLIETHEKLYWPEHGADSAGQWPVLLDGDWLDLFWAFRGDAKQPAEPVSKAYFRTFFALAVNFHASEGEFKPEWVAAGAEDNEVLWSELFTKEALISVFRRLKILSSDARGERIRALRDRLKTAGVGSFSEKPLDEAFFEGNSSPTYESRLWLHAVVSFFDFELENSGHRETDWFRVIRNLVWNSKFDEKSFPNAIQSISKLASECLGCPETLPRSVLACLVNVKDHDTRELKGLNLKQLEEESQKAALILQPGESLEWEMSIRESENHPVFEGQIGFLLSGKPDLTNFRKRWNVVQDLLDNKGSKIGKDRYLLARAALSKCVPIQLVWQQRLEFADTTAKNWKVLLGYHASETPYGMLREGLRMLTDHLSKCPDSNAAMLECCGAERWHDNWMDDVIRFGEFFFKEGVSSEKKVQNYQNNGTFIYNGKNSSDWDIMLGMQARWRNLIIHSLITGDSRWYLKEEWRTLHTGVGVPFYKGHEFHLFHKTQIWRVNINYYSVILQRKEASSHEGSMDEWKDVLKYEFGKLDAANVATRIVDKVASLDGFPACMPMSKSQQVEHPTPA